MIPGFEVICKYPGVPPSPEAFFFLCTLTRPIGGDLTTGWLSFGADTNRNVFLLYKESFHHFKPFYFKIFGAPGTISLWEAFEGEFRFNCY